MEKIPPTKQALSEALSLSGQVLEAIEKGTASLESIALKVSRLANLLNDSVMQRVLEYETKGYPPCESAAADKELMKIAEITERVETMNGQSQLLFGYSIGQLEENLILAKKQKNSYNINKFSKWTSSRKSFLHRYALKKNHELKFSGIPDDIFARVRERVDDHIGNTLPDSIKSLIVVYDDLKSKNCVDWSNSVHTCRRILQDLADKIFPPTDQIRKRGNKEIKLQGEHYINRIIAFIEDSSSSERFQHLVGSQIEFLGNRLDSIYEAANKGSHKILQKEEADRYVIYTYLLIGDILSLLEKKNS